MCSRMKGRRAKLLYDEGFALFGGVGHGCGTGA